MTGGVVFNWLEADPFGDPLRIDWEAAWRLHAQRLAGRGYDRISFRPEAERFLDALAGTLAGDAVRVDLVEWATRLGLDGRWRIDQLEVVVPERVADVRAVARIADDIAPSVGNDAPERVVGPWATGLDARRPADLDVLQTCLATCCFVEVDEDPHERTPFLQWVRRKPHPSLLDRDEVRAIQHTTPGAWRVAAINGEGWLLEDLLGLAPRALPAGPVPVTAASVQGATRPGDLLLARVVRTTQGFVAPFGFTLRGCPDRARIAAWVRAEAWVRRLDHKLPSREEMLREWPHTLWRRAHEWAWANA